MPATRRVGFLGVVALILTVALSGCMPGFACPAIGWSNSLSVVVEGDTAAVHEVRVCDAAGDCGPAPPVQRCDDVECEPTEPPSLPGPGHRDGDTWTFSFMMSRPERVTVRVLAADGGVLLATTARPDWVRVGGSERCGGPAEASVTVELAPSSSASARHPSSSPSSAA